MSQVQERLRSFLQNIDSQKVKLVAVSKTKPNELIQEAYDSGWKRFGENKVQELAEKYEALPKDIEWHLIGSLQTNKVKYIAPFVALIHSLDRLKLIKEVNKQGEKIQRKIPGLIQIHIAEEATKSGFSFEEAEAFLSSGEASNYPFVSFKGFMGMATNTNDPTQIKEEFKALKSFQEKMQTDQAVLGPDLDILSMGMSGDYQIAIEEGSNMIRVGSAIFGPRQYH